MENKINTRADSSPYNIDFKSNNLNHDDEKLRVDSALTEMRFVRGSTNISNNEKEIAQLVDIDKINISISKNQEPPNQENMNDTRTTFVEQIEKKKPKILTVNPMKM